MELKNRRSFLSSASFAATMGLAGGGPVSCAQQPDLAHAVSVTRFGAVGDGRHPSAGAFQQAIDAAEAAGGGMVHIPPGEFILERTPLVGSRVHLVGSGAATVLRGQRTGGYQGAALISNKGQHSPGYSGAHDWSISHVAINSPDTNGIVIIHADRVYIGFIYGEDVHHHFLDIVGRNVLCEHLFLTGRSGTSAFQVDSVSSAQTIWDGGQAVPPLRDGTDAQDLILRNSIITAEAGHTGRGPQHSVSIHFHGDEARGFLFSDLVLGGAATGFYQDAGSAYHDLHLSNVRCLNPGRAVWLAPGKTDQQRLTIRGLSHIPQEKDGNSDPYRGLEIHGRNDLMLSDIQLAGGAYQATDFAALVAASGQVSLRGIHACGRGGRGIVLRDDQSERTTPMAQTLVCHCLLQGFETGCVYENESPGAVFARDNLFTDVDCPYQGIIDAG